MDNPFNPGYFFSDELVNFGFKEVGKNVRVAKNCTIVGLANVSLGDNVRIDGNAVLSAASGSLIVGNYVHIGGNCFLGCAGGVTLSDFSGLSQGVRVYSSSDDYSGTALTNPTVPPQFLNVRIAPVHVGKHVIVGSGSVLLPGVRIEDGSSVGALSLVNKSLEGWGVYFGTPAKRIKERSRKLLEFESALYAFNKHRV